MRSRMQGWPISVANGSRALLVYACTGHAGVVAAFLCLR